MRALVVDDSRAMRIIIGQMLREIGMEVLEAGDGVEALDQMKRNPDVELVLLDWNMPAMNGLEFIRVFRSERAYDSVYVMMVTSEAQSEKVNQALNAGANEYLMKPFNKDVLLAKLNLLDLYQEQQMAAIRVLVVDDSVVIRRLVANELVSDPALDVVGTAANGRIALSMMPQVAPDLVILDVEMPELDGLATLRELRRSYPRVRVIMFSALTQRGAEATLDALALGAADYVAKPTGEGGREASLQVVQERLIPLIKSLFPVGDGARTSWDSRSLAVGSPVAANFGEAARASAAGAERRGPIQVVAIGVSTGGPIALAEVFRRLPADFPVPILIVQHMPPMFTRLLAERLSAEFAVPVREPESGSALEPGLAWIAPGDYHMIVTRNGDQVRARLNQDPPENSCRPAVDVLLRSVARTYGPDSLAVILTGMGQDGLRGCEAVREAGGQILAQDEASSVVWGMPGAVARAGLADDVLPLTKIGDEILRRVNRDRAR